MAMESLTTILAVPTDDQAVPAVCPSKKKVFESKDAAEAFALEIDLKYPNQARQYAYQCENCPSYHLSSLPPQAHGMASSRSQISLTAMEAAAPARPRGPHGETKAKVLELHGNGLTNAQIAEKLGLSVAGVGYHLLARRTKREPTSTVLTLHSIELQKRELMAQLEKLQSEEARLRELKTLKVMPCTMPEDQRPGYLIRKEHNSLALSVEDCKELVEALEEFLTK